MKEESTKHYRYLEMMISLNIQLGKFNNPLIHLASIWRKNQFVPKKLILRYEDFIHHDFMKRVPFYLFEHLFCLRTDAILFYSLSTYVYLLLLPNQSRYYIWILSMGDPIVDGRRKVSCFTCRVTDHIRLFASIYLFKIEPVIWYFVHSVTHTFDATTLWIVFPTSFALEVIFIKYPTIVNSHYIKLVVS